VGAVVARVRCGCGGVRTRRKGRDAGGGTPAFACGTCVIYVSDVNVSECVVWVRDGGGSTICVSTRMSSEPKTQQGMARCRVDAVSRAQLTTQDDSYDAN